MKFYEKIPTNIDWDNFLSKTDLIHNDQPVLIKNFIPNPDEFLSWDDVEDVINYSKEYIHFMNKTSEKKVTSISPPTSPSFYDIERQDKQFIVDHVNKGHNFVYHNASLFNPLLYALCSEIDDVFYTKSEIQVFGSKHSGSDSFTPHTDPNPIFAIQTYGTIDWVVYDNSVTHLFPRPYIEHYTDFDKLTNPTVYTLEPGDFLYLPERTFHQIKVKSPRLTLSVQCMDPTHSPHQTIDRNYYQI